MTCYYDRELSEKEMQDYELDYVQAEITVGRADYGDTEAH